MCQVIEEYGDERAAQGAHNKAIEAARSFYAYGVSVEIIAKSLNMSEEQVKEIVLDDK